MFDELPTAQRDSDILSAYFELAAKAKPNTRKCCDAQLFAREHFLGVTTKKGLADASEQLSGTELENARSAFPDFVDKVIKSLTGSEFQTAASSETKLQLIEKSHPGIFHTTRKTGVNIGAIQARSASGK